MQKNFIFLLILSTFGLKAQISTTRGIASYYANKFEGKTTASGEIYRHENLTAAHRSFPFGTLVKVTNLSNGKSVIVRINDRGPFSEERLIDLSKSAAEALGFIEQGVIEVEITPVSPETQNSETKTPAQSSINQNTPNTQTSSSTNAIPSVSTTFYRLNSQKVNPSGFGVQIGSFQESLNLLERVSAVQQTLKAPITIQVVTPNGIRIYRLIVGPFETRAQAEYFKDSIKESYPGFVVSF